MELSSQGLEHIKHFEGLSLESYICPGGALSIGYGHAGKDVQPNTTITEQQANELLLKDVRHAESIVNRLVTVTLTQGQFDACVDFVYNIGAGNFKNSTLLRLINANLMDRAAEEFSRWVFAQDKPLEGLVKRREAARKLFLA